jgi:hypothetical protein
MTSIFETVTVEQFKEYYVRDFSFLPVFEYGKTYWKDDIVYWTDENFYKSLTDDNGTTPDDTENWKKVKGNIYDYVTDTDIMKAYTQALANSNSRFGKDCSEKIMIFLHLMAFYLVVDMQNAAIGLGSSYSGLVASKSVDGVSESYNFPTWMTESPMYSLFSSNGYGLKYLSLILPYLACPILFSRGDSTCG